MSSPLDKKDVYRVGHNFRLAKAEHLKIDPLRPLMDTFIMWEPPISGFKYTIGVDLAMGLGQGNDRSVIHVLRNGTMHNNDAQVGEFITDSITMPDLTPILYALGNMYTGPDGREALMSVEVNLSEEVIYGLRSTYNYGNIYVRHVYDSIKQLRTGKLGWITSSKTRPKLISKALQYAIEGWWDVSSPWLVAELQTLEKKDDDAKIQAATGTHDDIFFAAAIALWTAHDEEFTHSALSGQHLELAAQRAMRKERQKLMESKSLVPSEQTIGYANTDVSLSEQQRRRAARYHGDDSGDAVQLIRRK